MLAGMGVSTPIPNPGPTRRERVRAQTRDEILAAARRLVARGEGLSLRAVAREVGMTPPALYRYVEGHDDLLDLVGGALYDELIVVLEQARDSVPPDELPTRLTLMAHAFRGWALEHRHEYALLFANPLDTLHAEQHALGSTSRRREPVRRGVRRGVRGAVAQRAADAARPGQHRPRPAGDAREQQQGRPGAAAAVALPVRAAVVAAVRHGHAGGVRPPALGAGGQRVAVRGHARRLRRRARFRLGRRAARAAQRQADRRLSAAAAGRTGARPRPGRPTPSAADRPPRPACRR